MKYCSITFNKVIQIKTGMNIYSSIVLIIKFIFDIKVQIWTPDV